ncbi:hypothetical protein [Gramella sp. MAR_2010_147]|uniref:hypothetical protein n=1 Tax=Gramella sp. MAR_2010_147 TaxID=1250205 RepID=UPI00087B1C11|nr:hypothetical protein [Gramella sp. MAR_2010_147]SDS42159.1 GDSL-like Lipase/Acylhydrolase family protein [Gramella sp. MAR_2010_147]
MKAEGKQRSKMKDTGNFSRKKLLIFKISAVFLALMFIVLLEMILRFTGYGSDFPLFIEAENKPGYLYMNPNVSNKYFFGTNNATAGYRELFKAEKDSETKRIFVLGASTGIGYPYLKNGSFHRWLQYAMNENFPEQNIEVINLSLTAINSYTLKDFAKKLSAYHPDAVLIYAGHNEYYGALGVGAVNSLGGYPALVNIALQLREYRLVQLISGGIGKIQSLFKAKNQKEETLMKKMVAEQSISFGSETYRDGIEQFRYNFQELLENLNQNDIPVFLSTIASNEKDIRPFISDSTSMGKSANDYFLTAKDDYEKANYQQAKQNFIKAKNLDMLRFRAPSEINEIIRSFETNENVYLVDSEVIFTENSPHLSIGNELLVEHVHPNLQGYSLIGYNFYEALKNNNVLDLDWKSSWTLKEFRSKMPVTELDSLQGAYEVMMLKQGWPYYEQVRFDSSNLSIPEKIAGQLALRKISWEQAMESLYGHYYNIQDFEAALKISEAILLEYPNEPEFYIKAGDLAAKINDSEKALNIYKKTFKLKPSVTVARKITVNLIKSDQFLEAISYLEFIEKKDPGDIISKKLRSDLVSISVDSVSNKKLILAEVYYQVGMNERSKKLLDEFLKINPENAEARNLLKKL